MRYRYNEGINKGRNEGREENAKKVLDFIAKGYTMEDIQKELTATIQGQ